MKKGIYLQSSELEMEDKTVYTKHVIAQINEPNDKGYCDDPQIRSVYLAKDIMAPLPSGTAVTFNLDTKTKQNKTGGKYEVIIPVDIQVAKAPVVVK